MAPLRPDIEEAQQAMAFKGAKRELEELAGHIAPDERVLAAAVLTQSPIGGGLSRRDQPADPG